MTASPEVFSAVRTVNSGSWDGSLVGPSGSIAGVLDLDFLVLNRKFPAGSPIAKMSSSSDEVFVDEGCLTGGVSEADPFSSEDDIAGLLAGDGFTSAGGP